MTKNIWKLWILIDSNCSLQHNSCGFVLFFIYIIIFSFFLLFCCFLQHSTYAIGGKPTWTLQQFCSKTANENLRNEKENCISCLFSFFLLSRVVLWRGCCVVFNYQKERTTFVVYKYMKNWAKLKYSVKVSFLNAPKTLFTNNYITT